MGLFKKIIGLCDKAFFKIFNYHIDQQILMGIKGGYYRTRDKEARRSKWSRFRRESYYKSIIVLGMDGAGTLFFNKKINNKKISVIYTKNNFNKITSFHGIPVRDLSAIQPKTYANYVYVIASTYHADEYIEALHNIGIKHYYSFFIMECKRFHIRVRKSIIHLRYKVIPHFFARQGYFVNYIWFPFKAFMRVHKIPPFYNAKYGDLRQLKDIHLGERCFIVATGPSLRVEDVEALENEFTFGVNGVFKLFDKTAWRPTYYALCDPFVYPDYIKNGYDMNIDSFSKNGAFFSYSLRRMLKKNPNAKTVKQIPFCMLDHALTFNGKSLRYSADPLWGFYNLRTVVGFCINLADYMGFKEIYILGVDCDYITHGQHFDAEKSPNLLEYEQLVMAQEFLLGAFRFIKQQTEPHGIKIYNATRGGALNVFSRIKLEDAVGLSEDIQHSVPLYGSVLDDANEPFDAIDAGFNEEDDIMVSVIMLTYNHEKYIRRALNSVLKQKTNFRYEIVIGDDASPDNTASIIHEYVKKYPSVFNATLRRENVGGCENAYDLFRKAKGKYIANLEGDDYWTDEYKLQKQIDFLESEDNRHYIGCVHTCYWVDENGIRHPSIKLNNNLPCEGDYTIEYLRDGMWSLPGQTGTLTYRNIYRGSDDCYYDIIHLDSIQCDRSILMLLLSFGKIYCDPTPMSNYRFIANNATSHASTFTKNINRKKNMIEYFGKLEALSEQLFEERFSFYERKKSIFRQAIRDNFNYPNENADLIIEQLISQSEDPEEFRTILRDETYKYNLTRRFQKKQIRPLSGAEIHYLKKRDKWNCKLTDKLNTIISQNKELQSSNRTIRQKLNELNERLERIEYQNSGYTEGEFGGDHETL